MSALGAAMENGNKTFSYVACLRWVDLSFCGKIDGDGGEADQLSVASTLVLEKLNGCLILYL